MHLQEVQDHLQTSEFSITIEDPQDILCDGDSISRHISVHLHCRLSRDRRVLTSSQHCVLQTTLSTRAKLSFSQSPGPALNECSVSLSHYQTPSIVSSRHSARTWAAQRYTDRKQDIVPDHRRLHGTQLCVRDNSLAGHGLPGGKLFLS